MKFVLDLQDTAAPQAAAPDSPSTWSWSFCFSTYSVAVCVAPGN